MKLSLEQYLILYQHVLTRYDCRYDFPTRAFNYVDNVCKLYIVIRPNDLKENINVSEYLKSIKGEKGQYSKDTLRGDIAFNGLKKFIISKNKFSVDANIALDPIGMYRVITRETIERDRARETVELPLLFYAGQAVHTPNAHEIEKDFVALCTEQEVFEVKNKILNLKR